MSNCCFIFRPLYISPKGGIKGGSVAGRVPNCGINAHPERKTVIDRERGLNFADGHLSDEIRRKIENCLSEAYVK